MKKVQKHFIGAVAGAAVMLFCVAALAISGVIKSREARKTVSDAPKSTAPTYPVQIRTPQAPKVVSGQTNYAGQPVTVSCSTCHTTTEPNMQLRDASELDQFHQGMTYNHGALTCVSCHNKNDYDTLRLADGSPVEFSNVIQLCAQCHGPQSRDYRNGSHGGMNGHWDLTKGPRQRNNCIDCHDPHAPQYPVVMPVFKPRPLHQANTSKSNH